MRLEYLPTFWPSIYGFHVGKYSSPMGHMGYNDDDDNNYADDAVRGRR